MWVGGGGKRAYVLTFVFLGTGVVIATLPPRLFDKWWPDRYRLLYATIYQGVLDIIRIKIRHKSSGSIHSNGLDVEGLKLKLLEETRELFQDKI